MPDIDKYVAGKLSECAPPASTSLPSLSAGSNFWPTPAGSTQGDVPTGTQQVVAKLLVSNPIAGSVIGKVRFLGAGVRCVTPCSDLYTGMQAGANIEQLQRSSGARIQLSRTGEFYPGL